MKRKMGYCGTLVLFLILTILAPTKLADVTGEGSPVQDLNPPPPSPEQTTPPRPPEVTTPPRPAEETSPSPEPSGRLLKRQPPPIAPIEFITPRPLPRPPPTH
ncbi:hypothetical protein V8G54_028511 [Vigna mungo]|uniref:Uncharacterized protein n=1 Tax=Vigna mungo TaxID=3915 RepID=A0AAQ3MST6_VIGMU